MGPSEILKLEVEREERAWIMMELQKEAMATGVIPEKTFLLDRLRKPLEVIGSILWGFCLGLLSMYFIYATIQIMK